MSRNYIMVDLDDPRTAKLSEVMSNATCKKILSLLAERELSESEIAKELNSPLNTINYNMKKLASAGLVELVRSLWSVKGRSVKVYRISQKKIVISPRTLTRGVLPAFIVALFASLLIASLSPQIYSSDSLGTFAAEKAVAGASNADSAPALIQPSSFYEFLAAAPNSWAWFLIGALVALTTLSLWSWLKR